MARAPESPNTVAPSFHTTTAPEFAAGRILVEPAPSSTPLDLARLHDRVGARVDHVLPGRIRVVRLPQAVSVEQAVRRYERSPAVAFAEPDYRLRPAGVRTVTPNDPEYPRLFGLHNTGQTGGTSDADIDAPEAWGRTTGDADTVIAVIDTGVDVRHPDLADNVWRNVDEIPGNGVDDDANGYVDDVHGWDFVGDDNTVFDGAADAHGTHVAGTIAAVGGNGVGVTGVAWRGQVMVLKFLGEGGGYTSDAIAALHYAVANGARISNNSWGGPGHSQALQDAIEAARSAGHLFVTAAGNGGIDGVGDDIDTSPQYPASYPPDNILTVAATGHDDALATFSNYGTTSVDLAAPGVAVWSTLPENAYGAYSGTSMAAPHVSGTAALVLSQQPGLSLANLRARILDTADRITPLATVTASGGRVNAGTAVSSLEGSSLTISTSPTTIAYGGTATLAGRLSVAGEALPDQPVTLQSRPVDASAWSVVPGGTVTTGADGTYRLAGVAPSRNTDYRARYTGDDALTGYGPATSAAVRVNVRVRVSLRMSTTDLALGGARVIRGSVAPGHGGTVRVVISRDGEVVARRDAQLDDSRFRMAYTPRATGRYTVYVIRFADADHLGGRSAAKAFTAVR
ncbi:MAG: S8 family serine peptidase [Actinomycetota bacterium]|nr:S8 family serine peptidase [Actinomycetota bacterium]